MRALTRLSTAAIAAAAILATSAGSASAAGIRSGHRHHGARASAHTPVIAPSSFHPPVIHGPGGQPAGSTRAVFVQSDNTAGNQIVSYSRSSSGALTQAGVFDTGGAGGVLEGSEVDHLASQGSLTYDAANGLLYAVNAGSNTVSVFAVLGDQLALRQVISSGGSSPSASPSSTGSYMC